MQRMALSATAKVLPAIAKAFFALFVAAVLLMLAS